MPGLVETGVSREKRPLASAIDKVNGLTVEPGSKTSVTDRLRNLSPEISLRLLGLKSGTLAIANTSPV